MGVVPHRGLWQSWKTSSLRKTAFVNGEIAAMFGLSGTLLSQTATPWLMTTPQVELVPIAFVKEGRRWLRKMVQLAPRLENKVLADYTGAIRLLETLGFTIGEPYPFGPENALFRTFSYGLTWD